MEEIAQALGITHGRVSTILYDPLGMRKLTGIGSPNPLAMTNLMVIEASVCSALLKHFRSKDDFLLTVDETLIHYYELWNKAQELSVGTATVPDTKRSSKHNYLLAR